jgi:CheY-like chemotaxis protein
MAADKPDAIDLNTALVGWKEIARYMGKTVRTVQRWERTLGLPVRRLENSAKQVAIAYPEELERWIRTANIARTTTNNPHKNREQLERLHSLSRLMVDRSIELNQRLRSVLESASAAQNRLTAARGATECTILAVDDNVAHNYAISRILQSSGFQVLRAFTGQQALDFASHNPCLILLDIHLPDLDGFEVCRRLKNNPDTEPIPVVFVTATCRDSAARATARDVGAETVLFYPVESDYLLSVIKAQIAN